MNTTDTKVQETQNEINETTEERVPRRRLEVEVPSEVMAGVGPITTCTCPPGCCGTAGW